MATTSDLIRITLVNSDHPMRVSELIREIGGSTEKKAMNSLLYALQERGMVERTAENPPFWSATVAAVSTVGLENNDADNGEDKCITYTQDEHNLVTVLTEYGKEHGMSAGSIAAFLGKSIALTNKMLYGLERDNMIIRRSRSCPPIWKIQSIVSNATEHRSSSSSDSSSPSDELVESSGRKRQNDFVCHKHSSGESVGKRAKLDLSDETKIDSKPHVAGMSPRNFARKREIQESLSKCHNPGEFRNETVWAKSCGEAVWMKYRSLNADAKDSDIIAGFIVCEHKYPSKMSVRPRVVAIGSGTKSVSGDKLSCDGTVVHDSHAEVIARRSLIRWLYSQLQNADTLESIAIRNEKRSDKPFRLRSCYFWFYTSQTPCGDSAVYSRNLPNAKLCWQGNHNGSFRIKIEAGQGSCLAPENGVQSFDGLMLGDRVMHHTCSDKMAKWSVLGVQGALLSRLVDPIYITGVIVGNVYSHGHICRAICCRSDYALKISSVTLQTPFQVKHPWITHAPQPLPRSEQIKKKGKLCYNWAEQDVSSIEVYDGTAGRLENGTESCICKKRLFESFSKLYVPAAKKSYSENKALGIQYQRSKEIWKDSMSELFGSWLKKPSEVDEFWMRHDVFLFNHLKNVEDK